MPGRALPQLPTHCSVLGGVERGKVAGLKARVVVFFKILYLFKARLATSRIQTQAV